MTSLKSWSHRLESIGKRYAHIQDLLGSFPGPSPQEQASLGKEAAELAPLVGHIAEWETLCAQQQELIELLVNEKDAALLAMAEEEKGILNEKIAALELTIQGLLLPKDSADDKSAILEIRAGTGGEEAALFAGDLWRMYERYSVYKGWVFETMQLQISDLGGIKEGIASIRGRGVFARLKFESGVHRVQRVPATETSGRIHTSAATVAILPEAEEVDIVIHEKDLRIDVFRSSGPGGQSVNTTDSAVRITHLPTGLVVQQQDEKSQHKNKAKALKILRSRLFEQQREEQNAQRSADRKNQVGSGDRSERIRTYNFPQNRVTDHRVQLTLHKLEQVLLGENLDELIDVLVAEDQARRLAQFHPDETNHG